MKKLVSLLTVGMISLSPLITTIACSEEEGLPKYVESTLDLGTNPNKKEQVFAISDAGDFEDGSFNQQTGDAVEEFLGGAADPNKKKPKTASTTDIEKVMNSLIKGGAKVLVSSGFLHQEALNTLTPQNPQIAFVFLDGVVKAKKEGEEDPVNQGNVLSWIYKMEQPSFIAGYRAAEYAFNNDGGDGAKVATFGGMEIPSVTSFMEGFKQGVNYWNEENTTKKVEIYDDQSPFIGNFDADKDNVVSRKTETLIDEGIDVILPVGGPQAFTVLKEVSSQDNKKHIRVIGVDTKMNEVKKVQDDEKEFILGSVVKEIKNSIVESLQAIYGQSVADFDNKTGKDVLGLVKEGTLDNKLATYWSYDSDNDKAVIESDQDLINKAKTTTLSS